MEVVPLSVGEVSRAWDEQAVDLTSATRKISGASTAGFTAAVSGVASRFTTTWERHTQSLADTAEARADGLRTTIADYLTTDDSVGEDYVALMGYTTELR